MNDNGKVVGVADADKLLEDIPNKVRDVLGIIVDVNLLEENGLKYIEIDVPPYSNPINYKVGNADYLTVVIHTYIYLAACGVGKAAYPFQILVTPAFFPFRILVFIHNPPR